MKYKLTNNTKQYWDEPLSDSCMHCSYVFKWDKTCCQDCLNELYDKKSMKYDELWKLIEHYWEDRWKWDHYAILKLIHERLWNIQA